MSTTLNDDYRQVVTSNREYTNNKQRWEFLLNSYVGGKEYRDAAYLTRYQLESDGEYAQRLRTTPLDNQCQSVVGVYMSYLFREDPDRDLKALEMYGDVKDFLKDCDYEGRSLDAFMKDVAVWSSVFGHAWILMTKPNINAVTMAEEMAAGVRPYLNLLTPLAVMDWTYTRQPNGSYKLTYLKYIEEIVDKVTVVREWDEYEIRTWEVNDEAKEAALATVEMNMLGMIPAVLAYNKRSIVKGIGVSDINDIADLQLLQYNLMSEVEQAHRLEGHPSLVVTPDVQYGSGAGAVIVVPENSDPGLRPYVLENGTANVSSLHESIGKLTQAVDRISYTGGVRGTETRTLSGVALEVEFGQLNARLAEKARNLGLAEEQLWDIYCVYQGYTNDVEVSYPESFNVRDTQREFQQLKLAKDTATDPRVIQIIDHELVELLGEDADILLPEMVTLQDGTEVPYDSAEPFDEPEEMFNPATGETGWVIDFDSKREAMMNGWIER